MFVRILYKLKTNVKLYLILSNKYLYLFQFSTSGGLLIDLQNGLLLRNISGQPFA